MTCHHGLQVHELAQLYTQMAEDCNTLQEWQEHADGAVQAMRKRSLPALSCCWLQDANGLWPCMQLACRVQQNEAELARLRFGGTLPTSSPGLSFARICPSTAAHLSQDH